MSFIPTAFKAVNKAAAMIIQSQPIHGVDFPSYISTFAGSAFLTTLPPINWQDPSLIERSVSSVSPDRYKEYFYSRCIRNFQAQSSELQKFDMFGIPLETESVQDSIYSLYAPGLREGTLLIAYGDTVLLRQLILDPRTNMLRGVRDGGAGFAAPGFTGYQFNSVVLGVDKSKGKLILRVDGIMAGVQDKRVNVSFIVNPRLLDSIGRALAIASNEVHDIAKREATYSSQASASSSKGSSVDGSLSLSSSANTAMAGVWTRRMLFPSEQDWIARKGLSPGSFKQSWFDQQINYEQKKAVDAIQSKRHGDIPFLIYGPPGTGKTKTVCETALQLARDPKSTGSILLCAPSEPAADTLASRLKQWFSPDEMLRLNDFSRTFAEVPQELLTYCYVEGDMFSLPPMPRLMAYKIVVTTCLGADVLEQARLTNRDLVSLEAKMSEAIHPPRRNTEELRSKTIDNHWEALLVDEAAQATEPEILIPLMVVAPHQKYQCARDPLFVMAGDQHQLGPRTYDRSTDLHISLFERLSKVPVYNQISKKGARTKIDRHVLNQPFVHLIRNYRSHPSIIAVSSSLFYSNTLVPEAANADSLASWSGWQGQRWPVLFACNGGADICENIMMVGGGWFNRREAGKALYYAQSLLNSGLVRDQTEICIMSPFRAQVNLLRNYARRIGLWGLNIGPMEAFQGLESRVVIVCTTRARKRFLDDDHSMGVGLVGEPKKFNVAITRAKEGLIVLGNPHVLATDDNWLCFLQFCQRNGLWQTDGEPNDTVIDGTMTEDFYDWQPAPTAAMDGLEQALIYKETEKWKGKGSLAAQRFMGREFGQSPDERIWASGLAAEMEVGHLDDGEEEEADPGEFENGEEGGEDGG